MSIDLEAFRKAEAQIEREITWLHRDEPTKGVLLWMLVQIDDLTKKVAELEAKCEEQDRFSDMRPIR